MKPSLFVRLRQRQLIANFVDAIFQLADASEVSISSTLSVLILTWFRSGVYGHGQKTLETFAIL